MFLKKKKMHNSIMKGLQEALDDAKSRKTDTNNSATKQFAIKGTSITQKTIKDIEDQSK
jgi:hypothetical protein